MDKPIAQFGFSNQGLTLQFENTSLNDPTSFLWDFGDGNISTEESPVHTYNELGFFSVKLIAISEEGSSEPLEMKVLVGKDIINSFNANILELVSYYTPNNLSDVNTIVKQTLIQKWQMYLQPLVYIPYPVDPMDVFIESRWPPLVNNLIAQLVSHDIILNGASKFLIDLSNPESTEITDKKGSIKSIETGPAKTEWYENSKIDIEKIGKAYESATKPGGIFDMLKEGICQLSARVRIYLPMCGQLSHDVIAPSVITKSRCSKHNANPFGITKRML